MCLGNDSCPVDLNMYVRRLKRSKETAIILHKWQIKLSTLTQGTVLYLKINLKFTSTTKIKQQEQRNWMPV